MLATVIQERCLESLIRQSIQHEKQGEEVDGYIRETIYDSLITMSDKRRFRLISGMALEMLKPEAVENGTGIIRVSELIYWLEELGVEIS